MAATLVGFAAAGTSSITLPAHQAGDLIIAFACNFNGSPFPTKPSDFTDLSPTTTTISTRPMPAAGRPSTGSLAASPTAPNAPRRCPND